MNLAEVDLKLDSLNFHKIFVDDNVHDLPVLTDYTVRNSEILHHLTGLIYKIASKGPFLDPSEISLLYLMETLCIVEGFCSYLMNVVIYALILKEHHNIWNNFTKQNVSSFDELFKIPMATREKYLMKHKFGFFSDLIDRELRNSIAHLNFKISENGDVLIIEDRKVTKKYSLMDLLNVVNTMSKNMSHIIQKIHYQITGHHNP